VARGGKAVLLSPTAMMEADAIAPWPSSFEVEREGRTEPFFKLGGGGERDLGGRDEGNANCDSEEQTLR